MPNPHRDPFEMKQYPKWMPNRLLWTLAARRKEKESKRRFSEFNLPLKHIDPLPTAPPGSPDSAVTPEHASCLLGALEASEPLGGSVVEIGAYRGVTTKMLAGQTRRKYFAVDPYQGYGGAEEDYRIFQTNTAALNNLTHLRDTSGRAAGRWDRGPISFIFIDAVHDYVNVAFDTAAWEPHVAPGGFIAFHDTDSMDFAGVHRAVWEASHTIPLYAHVHDLAILRKPG